MPKRALPILAAAALMAGVASSRAGGVDPADAIFAIARTRAEIAVIDSRTDALVGRIPLPGIPDQILSLDKGARLAAASAAQRKVWIVDVAARRLDRTLAVPLAPRLMQADGQGTGLAVLDPDGGAAALVSLSDGAAVPISGVPGARYAVFDRDGDLLVAHDSSVAVVDAAGRTQAELPASPGDGPVTHVAVDPGGEYAFLAQADRGVLSVFRLRTATRAATLRLPPPLGRSVPSADSQFVLVPTGRHAVSIISTWTLRESGRFEVTGAIKSVGLALLQTVAAVATNPGQRLFLYDLADRRRIANLPLAGAPAFGAASPDGQKYYVALADTGQIAVVPLIGPPRLSLIDGVGPGAWAVVSALGDAYCH